jgi:hypothetical protein
MLLLANREAIYFSQEGWTRALRGGRLICPSGNVSQACVTTAKVRSLFLEGCGEGYALSVSLTPRPARSLSSGAHFARPVGADLSPPER